MLPSPGSVAPSQEHPQRKHTCSACGRVEEARRWVGDRSEIIVSIPADWVCVTANWTQIAGGLVAEPPFAPGYVVYRPDGEQDSPERGIYKLCRSCAIPWKAHRGITEPADTDVMKGRAAEALADAVEAMVRCGALDARSLAADALLDYRDPHTSERADQLVAAHQEIEQLQTQLAGCGVAANGGTDSPAKQGDYGWSPAYQDVLDLRIRYENVYAELSELREAEPQGTVVQNMNPALAALHALEREAFVAAHAHFCPLPGLCENGGTRWNSPPTAEDLANWGMTQTSDHVSVPEEFRDRTCMEIWVAREDASWGRKFGDLPLQVRDRILGGLRGCEVDDGEWLVFAPWSGSVCYRGRDYIALRAQVEQVVLGGVAKMYFLGPATRAQLQGGQGA